MQEEPVSTFSRPIRTDYIAGVGEGVSYAVTTKSGNIQLPLFTSSIAIMLSGIYDQEKNIFERLGNNIRATFENYFIVGQGDVASVLDTVFKIRGLATGGLEGHVIDAYSYIGLSGISVFVFKDPRDPGWELLYEDWQQAGPEKQKITLDNLLYAVRNSGNEGDRERISPLVSQIETDRFEDKTPDGSFRCRLQPGAYLLLAYDQDRSPGNLVPVKVTEQGNSKVTLALTPPGRAYFEVKDEEGNLVPAKVTFRGLPLQPDSAVCRHNDLNPECKRYGDPEPFLGDGFNPNHLSKVVFTHNGVGTVRLEPGDYE